MLTEQVGHLLRRAHQRHTAIFQDMIGQAQLTPTQYAALVKIRDLGEVSQNELGRMTAMDPATIQGVARRLMARGLMQRSPDTMDRRTAVLEPTDAGVALITRVVACARRAHEAAMSPLSPEERVQFLALLRRMG